MSRHSSPPLFAHLHHLNCVLLDPSSRCASPHSIDGVTLEDIVWSTSRIVLVQVGQMLLDHYTAVSMSTSSPFRVLVLQSKSGLYSQNQGLPSMI